MSTHIELLRSIAMCYGDPVYIEIGLGDGGCFLQIQPHCKIAYGVDVVVPPSLAMQHPSLIWHLSSDVFFERYDGPKANLIFIDGSHWEEQVFKDWENALKILAPLGTIALHDSWSDSEFEASQGSDTAYKVAEFIENDPRYDCYTLPIRPGLTLARPHVERFA